MKFSKDAIIDFYSKQRAYLTWRKNLDRFKIKEAIFPNTGENVYSIFPGKNIEYCNMLLYDICVGDYQLGLKYTEDTGTYYMFLGANTDWAAPGEVAVGKAIDGQIYLLKQIMYPYSPSLNLRVVPEECINKRYMPSYPHGYEKSIWMMSADKRRNELRKEITDEDVKYLKIAYEGVRAFSKLIGELE